MSDRRDDAFDPFYGTFDEKRMIGLLYEDGSPVHCHYEVCDVCDGRGTHVHPGVDSHGISAEEFHEDPDFAESYMSGHYDVQCYRCRGKNVIPVPDEDDPNIAEYNECVHGHYEMLAEMRAEQRMGA